MSGRAGLAVFNPDGECQDYSTPQNLFNVVRTVATVTSSLDKMRQAFPLVAPACQARFAYRTLSIDLADAMPSDRPARSPVSVRTSAVGMEDPICEVRVHCVLSTLSHLSSSSLSTHFIEPDSQFRVTDLLRQWCEVPTTEAT